MKITKTKVIKVKEVEYRICGITFINEGLIHVEIEYCIYTSMFNFPEQFFIFLN